MDFSEPQKQAMLDFHNSPGGLDAVAALAKAFDLENNKNNRMAVFEIYKANILNVLKERQTKPVALSIQEDTRKSLADAEEPIVVAQGDYDIDVARLLAGDEDGSMDIKTLLIPPEVLPPVAIATEDMAKDIKEPFLFVKPAFDKIGNRITVSVEKRNVKKDDCGC